MNDGRVRFKIRSNRKIGPTIFAKTNTKNSQTFSGFYNDDSLLDSRLSFTCICKSMHISGTIHSIRRKILNVVWKTSINKFEHYKQLTSIDWKYAIEENLETKLKTKKKHKNVHWINLRSKNKFLITAVNWNEFSDLFRSRYFMQTMWTI